MSTQPVPLKLSGFGNTRRTDAWWLAPLAVLVVFTAFLVYGNWRVFENQHYYSAHGAGNAETNYLAPFYSPLFFDVPGLTPSGHAWMASKPSWLPQWVSAAALILIFPAGFRFTCYYYRGAYYKAFWADPPSCAVAEPRSSYRGEEKLPLIFQNIHRYFMYFAILIILVLAWDTIEGFKFKRNGVWHFGIGVGSIIMVVNVVLLSCYTFGCHSFRHLIGGFLDRISESPVRKKVYDCSSCLNRRHMMWAWFSLFGVAFTDIYVRMCAAGVWTDAHIVF